MPLKVAILVSGRGSNMASILEAIKEKRLDAQVSVVFSNNPEAPALSTARKFGVRTESLSHRGMSRREHEERVVEILSRYEFDFVVLAGYMRVLTPLFLEAFKSGSKKIPSEYKQLTLEPQLIVKTKAEGDVTATSFFRVINIHPSLLPAFPGAHAYEDAFNYGVRLSGITVHLVDEKVDHGAILAQETFVRLENDDLESFKARGLALEHKMLPQVLQDISRRGISILPFKRGDGSAEEVLSEAKAGRMPALPGSEAGEPPALPVPSAVSELAEASAISGSEAGEPPALPVPSAVSELAEASAISGSGAGEPTAQPGQGSRKDKNDTSKTGAKV